MRDRVLVRVIGALTILVTIAFLVWQPSSVKAQSPRQGGTFVVGIVGDIARTDPAFTNDTNSWYVERQVMQGLVGLAPGSTTKVVPVLARAWAVSPDGLTYTFALRQGVMFHDGTPFNAAAVKHNYDRWRNLSSSLQSFAYYYGQVFGGFGSASNIVSVDVMNPMTIAIHLRHPQSNLLISQTQSPFAISSPTALDKGNADTPDPSKSAYQQGGKPAMVGTGPFIFKEWVPGDHVTLVRNPHYWNTANPPLLDSVVFKPITDDTAMLNALRSGGIDFAEKIAAQDLPPMRSNKQVTIVDRGASCTISVLDMNLDHRPLNNRNIRFAIAYALNRQAYVDTFFGGAAFAKPADGWMPSHGLYAKPGNLPKYNPAMARQLVRQSGVTNLTIDFWYPSNVARPYMPDAKGEFEAISNDLKAVGFKINPHTEVWSPNYVDDLGQGKFAMWLLGWTCDWNGPDNFLDTAFFGYVNGKPNPAFAYRNDRLNEAMNGALAASNETAARASWYQAQDLIRADMPTIPLVESNPPGVARSYVRGIVGSGSLTEYFDRVWLNK